MDSLPIHERFSVSKDIFTQTLLETLPIFLIVLKKDHTVQRMNDTLLQALGYSAEEVHGCHFVHTFIPPEEHLFFIAALSRLSSVRQTVSENHILTKDGGKILVKWHNNPVHNGNGCPSCYLIMGIDLTEQQAVENRLQTEKSYLAKLFENAPEAIVLLDNDGTLTRANSEFTRMFGYRPEDALGRALDDLIVPDEFREEASWYTGQVAAGGRISFESVRQRHDGSRLHVSVLAIPLYDEIGQTAIYCIYRDISEQKQAETALRESEERFRTILENIEDGYYEVNLQGRFTFFNPSLPVMLGYTPEELKELTCLDLMNKIHAEKVRQIFRHVLTNGAPRKQVEWNLSTKKGEEMYIEASVSPVHSNGNTAGFRGIIRDITDRKRLEEELRERERTFQELSITDGLTKLYNSRYFYQQLKAEVGRSNRYKLPLSLIMLDADHFKNFNDSYGHLEGDQVLVALARTIKEQIRETDSAYRYGGEEFTVILPVTTGAQAANVAERMRRAFRKVAFQPANDGIVNVTVSLGIAQFMANESITDFIKRADQRLYKAKESGRDRIFYEEERLAC
ncbi:MAG: PAS domain S-box protein [Deltaproteobacteria bacterium]|nr:PAS domain S-box protein [Deltaproteobacteria bacterium]